MKEAHDQKTAKNINRICYLLIAFHQGVSYISQLAVQYYFKDDLNIQPNVLANINSIIHIPWAIKPFLGLLTDMKPICGYRRKIYIILSGIISVLCWLSLAIMFHNVYSSCFILFLVNFCLSFASVLGEALVVELSQFETENKESTAKELISMFFFARTVGELISSYLKGLFVDILALKKIFLLACCIPSLLIMAGSMLIEKRIVRDTDRHSEAQANYGTILEDSAQMNQRNDNLLSQLFDFLFQKEVLFPLLFIIIFKATPSYSDPFFYFITNELKINATSLGKMYFCSTVAILCAILIYKSYLKECSFKIMIIAGTFVAFFINVSNFLLVLRVNVDLGISDFYLLLFTNSFLSMVGEFVLLPMLALACIICPKNLEGTVYSVFMSTLNLGGILSILIGGILTKILNITSTDFHNLHWLILISKLSTLLILPMICCIDEKYFNQKYEEKENMKIKMKEDPESITDDTSKKKPEIEK